MPLDLLILQQQLANRPGTAPTPVVPKPRWPRRFTVWTGTSLNPFQSIPDLALAAIDLVPGGHWDEVEVLVKAGEGGSYQASWLHPGWGDPNALAIDSPNKLQVLRQVGGDMGVQIVPYVVVRARENWVPSEQQMVRDLVGVAGRCILNLEPGSSYYNGPLNPAWIRQYVDNIGVGKDKLELCSIPRQGQVDELGGAACMLAWTSSVGSASWETYGISAGIRGPTSLLVDEAIPRVDAWAPPGCQYRIPVVQHDEVARWADSEWTACGLQVWQISGN